MQDFRGPMMAQRLMQGSFTGTRPGTGQPGGGFDWSSLMNHMAQGPQAFGGAPQVFKPAPPVDPNANAPLGPVDMYSLGMGGGGYG